MISLKNAHRKRLRDVGNTAPGCSLGGEQLRDANSIISDTSQAKAAGAVPPSDSRQTLAAAKAILLQLLAHWAARASCRS